MSIRFDHQAWLPEKGKGSSLNIASLATRPLASSIYVHVAEAPSPLKRSISVTCLFPSPQGRVPASQQSTGQNVSSDLWIILHALAVLAVRGLTGNGAEERAAAATAASGLQFVTGGVTDIKDVDDILAEGEDDPMLEPLLPAVEQFADFLGELVALGGGRASRRSGLQRVDGLVGPGQPFIGGG
jgi:hypothetical protein